jgi:hypothetical protein
VRKGATAAALNMNPSNGTNRIPCGESATGAFQLHFWFLPPPFNSFNPFFIRISQLLAPTLAAVAIMSEGRTIPASTIVKYGLNGLNGLNGNEPS